MSAVVFSTVGSNARQQGAQITEFALTGSPQVMGIAAGADGNLWTMDMAGNKIIRMTPSGAPTEFQLSAGLLPTELAAGPDGNIWYAGRGGIGKVTPAGQATHYKVDGIISSITPGPDGNLWFCENFRGKIGRATVSGQVTMFDVPTRPGGGSSNPHTITAGPDGNLWFTESNPGANRIGRITPDGKFDEFSLPTAGSPRGIAAGPDGNIWALQTTTFPLEDIVVRITPGGQITEFKLAAVQSSMALTIVSGSDGNLWFTEPNNPSNKVSRITATGDATRFTVPTPFSGPAGLTVGPDGNIWFTERSKNKIAKLQTAAANTKHVLHLASGFVPNNVTIEQGQSIVWVNKMPGKSTVQQPSTPSLMDSSARGTGAHFKFTFNVAGTYPYEDGLHRSHGGTVTVPMKVSPQSGSTDDKFVVTWAAEAGSVLPSGWVTDVQVQLPGKPDFETWQEGVTTRSAPFSPSAGSGEYRFRTRVRHSTEKCTSDWSPIAAIMVR